MKCSFSLGLIATSVNALKIKKDDFHSEEGGVGANTAHAWDDCGDTGSGVDNSLMNSNYNKLINSGNLQRDNDEVIGQSTEEVQGSGKVTKRTSQTMSGEADVAVAPVKKMINVAGGLGNVADAALNTADLGIATAEQALAHRQCQGGETDCQRGDVEDASTDQYHELD